MKLRVAIVAAVSLSDCLDPTEIRVVISTDVACSQVNSTAIAVGKPGDDSTVTNAKTSACSDDGGIGTIVLTPSHGIDDDVGIRVTLGVGAMAADQCVAPKFAGCIVARRSLPYYPHTPLTLPIDMQQACLDDFCDPSSTCVNGSCVDAGVPRCDPNGTCTIDAGVADAGSCLDIAPKLVVPTSAQVTPHLVQMRAGYAIGYETAPITDPTRTYAVIALDGNGAPGKIVQMASAIAQGALPGPLGTEGTNYAATFEPTGTAYMVREIDPNGALIHEVQTQLTGIQLPRQGMLYDSTLNAFVFFFVGSNGPTFELWFTSGAKASTSSLGLNGVSDPATAFFGGTYYGSLHDTAACYLMTLTNQGGSIGVDPTWPLCSTLRVAGNAPNAMLAATRESNATSSTAFMLMARAGFTSTATPTIIDAVDDQAIVALPGVGTQFHVVYGVSQSVRETVVDTATMKFTAPTTIANATGFGSGVPGSIGFDAIAEPNSMTHDVAFWASAPTPGIYFTRICN